jgi:hypothetical protein
MKFKCKYGKLILKHLIAAKSSKPARRQIGVCKKSADTLKPCMANAISAFHLRKPNKTVVLVLVLVIVLGDNKKNKSPNLSNNRISIKYALCLKNKFFKNHRSKFNFFGV